MKITRIEDLHCDAGWRNFSFLKVSTDEGLTGWSEYNESYGSQGLSGVIAKLGETLIGSDPRPIERITSALYARTRMASGGINQQAIGAIENAPDGLPVGPNTMKATAARATAESSPNWARP